MASVWMVHGENGMYSDRVYSVEGVFSSYEKAVAFVKRNFIMAYHHVGEATMDVYSRHVDEWSASDTYYSDRYSEDTSGVKVMASQIITPTTTDGRTFEFVLPDGTKVDEYDANTYYVTEYEVDARCLANK